MDEQSPITIVGGGIAGLTAAIALKQQNIPTQIFESAPEFLPVGAGINLAINATQILKRLNVYLGLLEKGNRMDVLCLHNHQGKVLAKMDNTRAAKKYGVEALAIHRADLHETLLNALQSDSIHFGKQLHSIQFENDHLQLEFTDGSTNHTQYALGCDGIHSKVRNHVIHHSNLRDTGQVCWRGVSNYKLNESRRHILHEYTGLGKRFGFVQINAKQVYWFAVLKSSDASDQKFDPHYYKEFEPIIFDIINHTESQIIFNPLQDLNPLPCWHKSRMCLIGDAAHAMSPNLGQGACQAIESAWSFANFYVYHKDFEKTCTEYQKKRYKKVISLVKRSWNTGKMAQSSQFFIHFFRNHILPLIPNRIKSMAMDNIYKI